MSAHHDEERIEPLQYVRALAILLTMGAHLTRVTDTPDPFYMNVIRDHFQFWGGVELFFVLSGFVITASLLRAGEKAHSTGALLSSFYLKRITRLMPAAVMWGSIILLASYFYNKSGTFGDPAQNWRHFLASVFFVQNINLVYDHVGTYSIYWSLSVEEQFYLLYPAILLFARKHLAWVCILLILPQFFMPRHVSQTELNFMVRYDALLMGCWLYAVHKHKIFVAAMELIRPVRLLILLALLYCIISAPIWFGKIDYAASATDFFALLFVAVTVHFHKNLVVKLPPLRGVLNWLGDRSYAIYLCHMVVFSYIRETGATYIPDYSPDSLSDPKIVIPFALVFICAELTYRFVEMPIRDWGRNLAARKRVSANQRDAQESPSETGV